MKADPGAQRRLLDLQAADTAMLQLKHKKSTLPVIAEIHSVRQGQSALAERYVAAETRASDAVRALARAEQDLEPVRERRVRDQQRVDSGQVSDAKALQALLDEIAHLGKRIGDLEDVQLEAMELVDATATERDQLKSELDGFDAKVAGLKEQYQEQARELDEQTAVQLSKRESALQLLPADLITLYDRIAAKSGGLAAAPLFNGRRCGGCGLEANPADVVRYQATPADEVLRCEECSRILVRQPEA